jgi:hypothetical protein
MGPIRLIRLSATARFRYIAAMTDPIQRRSFIKTGAAALAINGKILGANNRIRIAFVDEGLFDVAKS